MKTLRYFPLPLVAAWFWVGTFGAFNLLATNATTAFSYTGILAIYLLCGKPGRLEIAAVLAAGLALRIWAAESLPVDDYLAAPVVRVLGFVGFVSVGVL